MMVKSKRLVIILIFLYVLSTMFVLFFTIISTTFVMPQPDRIHRTFDSLQEAERELQRKLDRLNLPSDFKILKIEYISDGFTHPITKIFYNYKDQEIIYMNGSILFDNYEREVIHGKTKFEWIQRNNDYVLKWFDGKQSYHYLITKNKKDKDWLINIVEKLNSSP